MLDSRFEGRRHTVGLEALPDEIAEHASCAWRIVESDAATQPPIERLFQQGRFVELGEHLDHGRTRDVAGDPQGFNLAEHASPPALPDTNFGARAGQRYPAIVERPFVEQAVNRLVNLPGLELAPRKTRPQLRLGQLSPRQQLETRQIGLLDTAFHPVSLRRRGRA